MSFTCRPSDGRSSAREARGGSSLAAPLLHCRLGRRATQQPLVRSLRSANGSNDLGQLTVRGPKISQRPANRPHAVSAVVSGGTSGHRWAPPPRVNACIAARSSSARGTAGGYWACCSRPAAPPTTSHLPPNRPCARFDYRWGQRSWAAEVLTPTAVSAVAVARHHSRHALPTGTSNQLAPPPKMNARGAARETSLRTVGDLSPNPSLQRTAPGRLWLQSRVWRRTFHLRPAARPGHCR